MENATEESADQQSPGEPSAFSNSVGLIGVFLAVIAAANVGLLLILVQQYPDDASSFQQLLSKDTTAQLRLLIIGATGLVLSLVAFVISVIGLWLPDRPRLLAAIGSIVSLLLLLGVFGVVLTGALLNSASGNGSSSQAGQSPITGEQ